jgi:hypothetical protein
VLKDQPGVERSEASLQTLPKAWKLNAVNSATLMLTVGRALGVNRLQPTVKSTRLAREARGYVDPKT